MFGQQDLPVSLHSGSKNMLCKAGKSAERAVTYWHLLSSVSSSEMFCFLFIFLFLTINAVIVVRGKRSQIFLK